ncbi:hypothetical protein Q4610_06220 [Sphingobium sp. HBC34]|uniref:Uncharacterized protein n=1 Tax=Sphingobium cyanobacteriorum TaxID=3063954 RepID=A0ABT8ZKB2_9SPHN|nr:hypothetical protein [Sphingobium sp. HBC34]MDO7834637.1 hypothetical protein [Sphingobium sp. HBC34]
MSAYRAFGDESRRQALIADIRARGPIYTAWLTRASIEGDISFVSEDFGLHPALARLLPALGAFGEAEDTLSFHETLFDAIPVGADTGGLARQALLLAWRDPVYGRSKVVAPGPLHDACEDVIALVEQSIDAPVDKKAWRAARAKLANVGRDDAGVVTGVDMVMSLAWNLDQAPGAAHDVMTAWASGVNIEADASDEDCFSAEENATFETEMNRISGEAMEALSQKQSIDNIDVEDFLAEVDKIWAANPAQNALRLRAQARRERSNAKMAAWRAAIQRRVLEIANASLPARMESQPDARPARTLDQPRL